MIMLSLHIKFIDKTLKDKDLEPLIKISNIAITDFRFSPEFNRAIEMKVKAEQEALQAKNEKVKRITQAEGIGRGEKISCGGRGISDSG